MQQMPEQTPDAAREENGPYQIYAYLRDRYPRWALLSAIIYLPVLGIIYLVVQYDPSLFCYNHVICVAYELPSYIHIAIGTILYILIWQFTQFFSLRPLETTTQFTKFAKWMRKLSEWHTAKLPILVFAGASLLGILGMIVMGISIDPLIGLMIMIIFFAALISWLYPPPAEIPPQPDPAEGTPPELLKVVDHWRYLLWRSWLWRYFLHPIFFPILALLNRLFPDNPIEPANIIPRTIRERMRANNTGAGQAQQQPPPQPPPEGQDRGRFESPI